MPNTTRIHKSYYSRISPELFSSHLSQDRDKTIRTIYADLLSKKQFKIKKNLKKNKLKINKCNIQKNMDQFRMKDFIEMEKKIKLIRKKRIGKKLNRDVASVINDYMEFPIGILHDQIEKYIKDNFGMSIDIEPNFRENILNEESLLLRDTDDLLGVFRVTISEWAHIWVGFINHLMRGIDEKKTEVWDVFSINNDRVSFLSSSPFGFPVFLYKNSSKVYIIQKIQEMIEKTNNKISLKSCSNNKNYKFCLIEDNRR